MIIISRNTIAVKILVVSSLLNTIFEELKTFRCNTILQEADKTNKRFRKRYLFF